MNPRAMLARLLLVAFVVGGLIYFTSAFPVAVDVGIRLPYKVTSTESEASVRRRDVREITIVFNNQDHDRVAETQLYVDNGVGPEPTKPARLSLVPGTYEVGITLLGKMGRRVNVVQEVAIEEEGELLLDLR